MRVWCRSWWMCSLLVRPVVFVNLRTSTFGIRWDRFVYTLSCILPFHNYWEQKCNMGTLSWTEHWGVIKQRKAMFNKKICKQCINSNIGPTSSSLPEDEDEESPDLFPSFLSLCFFSFFSPLPCFSFDLPLLSPLSLQS